MSRPTILIIDCATTGFNPDKDLLLEVCCILVDARTYDVIATHSACIKPDVARDALNYPDFHEALVEECYAEDTNRLRAVEGFLLAGEWSRASAVCNRALDFDEKFLKVHMPTLYRSLPRTRVELKSLETLLAARGVPAFVDPAPRTYRASDDAISAYNELLHWMLTPAQAGAV